MGLEISILTWWRGRFMGQDAYGNKYYQDKKCRRDGKIHRWVVYKGHPEASKVPCEWHSWLHYTTDNLPILRVKHTWEKPHLRNLSGTIFAYKPQKIFKLIEGGKKDYEAWAPEK